MPATCYVIGCTNPTNDDYCTTCQAAITTALTPKTTERHEAGMREQTTIMARAIAKRFRTGKHDDARRLLNTLPEQYRDNALKQASRLLAGLDATPPAPTPPPVITDRQIASYRAYRATVSKSTRPILEESKRRAACNFKGKVAYEDTALGRAAADWHLNELRNIDGVYASVYMCDCGWLHISGGAR